MDEPVDYGELGAYLTRDARPADGRRSRRRITRPGSTTPRPSFCSAGGRSTTSSKLIDAAWDYQPLARTIRGRSGIPVDAQRTKKRSRRTLIAGASRGAAVGVAVRAVRPRAGFSRAVRSRPAGWRRRPGGST